MGVVSNEAIKEGGSVVGIIPQAMVAAGGEDERVRNPTLVYLDDVDRSRVCLHLSSKNLG